jgi:thiol-disulfide isomerase/thioredoxin
LNPNPSPLASNQKGNEEQSTKEDDLKRRLIAFGVGLLLFGIVFGLALLSSGDLRVVYIGGAVLLLCCGIWAGGKGKPDWFAGALLFLPLLAGFSFLVVAQVPAFWPDLLLWAAAVAIGLVVVKVARARHGLALIAMGAALLIGSFWYCVSYLPKALAREINHFTNASVPEFTLEPVSQGFVPTTWKPGKVLVIDFFATWCIPCNAELPELEAIQSELKNDSDIQFVLVGGPVGGDTPERLHAFAQRRNVTLPVAFDPRLRVRGAFHSTGLPTLVVIDRTGHVRLHREGYNPAETGFKRDMVTFLKTL